MLPIDNINIGDPSLCVAFNFLILAVDLIICFIFAE